MRNKRNDNKIKNYFILDSEKPQADSGHTRLTLIRGCFNVPKFVKRFFCVDRLNSRV